jgi:hypothetical protein
VELTTIDCLRISFTSSIRPPPNAPAGTAASADVALIPYRDEASRSIVIGDLPRSLEKSGVVPTVPPTTFILFCVSVLVLSEQIFVTLPTISQALSCRTRLLSFSILLDANASASVTARGSPSRTAMTRTVSDIIRILRKSWPFCRGECELCRSYTKNLMNSTTNKSRAAAKPNQAMALASLLSLDCKGVKLGSSFRDIRILL